MKNIKAILKKEMQSYVDAAHDAAKRADYTQALRLSTLADGMATALYIVEKYENH